jgi:hypothetical protein
LCCQCHALGKIKRRRLAVLVLSLQAKSELQASFRTAARSWVFSCRVWHLRCIVWHPSDLQKVCNDGGSKLVQWVQGLFQQGKVDGRVELWFPLTWDTGWGSPLTYQWPRYADNLRNLLGMLEAAGIHAQALLHATARDRDVDLFDESMKKTEACSDWTVFKIRNDGWNTFSTACWYGIKHSVDKKELLAVGEAAQRGDGGLSIIISRRAEVINEALLRRFLPRDCLQHVVLPWGAVHPW